MSFLHSLACEFLMPLWLFYVWYEGHFNSLHSRKLYQYLLTPTDVN